MTEPIQDTNYQAFFQRRIVLSTVCQRTYFVPAQEVQTVAFEINSYAGSKYSCSLNQLPALEVQTVDNTNWRAGGSGGLEGRVFK